METRQGKAGVIEAKAFLGTMIVLAVLIVLAGAATHLIPAGVFADGEYQRIPQSPVPAWKVLLAPLMVVASESGPRIAFLILFILFIGGSFSILNKSGILSSLLGQLVEKFIDRKRVFLVISVFLFSLMGSTLGILEEIVPMILLLVPIAYRMGWDSVTGMAIPFASAGCGFAAATCNPFTVGTAQRLADLPLFSGLSLRIPFFLITTLLVIAYLLYYTRRIGRRPSSSVTYASDMKRRENSMPPESPPGIAHARRIVFYLLFCFLLIGGIVISGTALPVVQRASFPLITLAFVCMGFGAGLMAGCGIRAVLRFFLRGVADFSPAIILILMAGSVSYLIRAGSVMDTILYETSGWIRGLGFGAGPTAILFYFFQMLMNLLVPGGVGQAVLTMPVLVPLGDMVGVSRQTVVLAFQCGDGFSNLIWPTNPVLIIALGLAGVRYRDWVRWVLPLQAGLLVVSVLFLLLAVCVDYR